MSPDPAAAAAFMTTHGRLLDRRRFQVLLGTAEPSSLLSPLEAYGNADGGYGWGLEPDLRAPQSQPVAAMLALEVLAEAGSAPAGARRLFQWLDRIALPDGGLPFALPIDDSTGCAQHWAQADPTVSSLQMTTQVAANAHLLAVHQPWIAAQPWLAGATRFCLDAIRDLDGQPHAYELVFALRFLDVLANQVAEADALLDALGRFVPADGALAVAGGIEGERLHPLDLAPRPDRPARRLFSAEVVAVDLERLAGLQQDDGGWTVDFASASPAAALEWRGYATLQAVRILRENGV